MGQNLKGIDVVAVMDWIKELRGVAPKRIQCDNGSELISKAPSTVMAPPSTWITLAESPLAKVNRVGTGLVESILAGVSYRRKMRSMMNRSGDVSEQLVPGCFSLICHH